MESLFAQDNKHLKIKCPFKREEIINLITNKKQTKIVNMSFPWLPAGHELKKVGCWSKHSDVI